MATDLIIATNIPWESLKGASLEECLYWLLDSMGAKNLEWRKGGTGGGAADQGRDVEATFHVSGPDMELVAQRWWIESKGRAGTVEIEAIQKAILNVAAYPEVDVLVVATNTQFSNPTIDWVKKRQQSCPRPIIKLWDRAVLERMLSRHPDAVFRFFADAISPQGRVELVRTRFWNQLILPTMADLKIIWRSRATIELSLQSVLALTVGEVANGDVSARQWPLLLDKEGLAGLLTAAIANTFSLATKAEQMGHGQNFILDSVAYVLTLTLAYLPFRSVVTITENALDVAFSKEIPENTRDLIVRPVVGHLLHDLARVCASDCKRVSGDVKWERDEEREDFWNRFRLTDVDEPEVKDPQTFLVIESTDEPCKVGFKLGKRTRCPLFDSKSNAPVTDVLATCREVIEKRLKMKGLMSISGLQQPKKLFEENTPP